ncbi:hypothetical protein EGM88_12695 [Aureibaculum marinum]|uniref:Uncharacterized protein n=1 Tax=Aureibaculum marinum TaxID=2487930 RepID=A0A3N4NF71_9FLAO|nr:hypothetical protein [Aureibaculum marinum]RPD94045.1 hypothetical protein EGM88_12695 [Aureibaculum marinum]
MKDSIKFIFYLVLLPIVITGCILDKISFNKEEVEMFERNSQILLENIKDLEIIKNDGAIMIKNKFQLDSLLNSNKFEFAPLMTGFTIFNDYIQYSLSYKKNMIAKLDPYMVYQHKIVFTKYKNAGKAIVDVVENGKKTQQQVYLIENGMANPKWANQWYEMNMVHSEKLSDNLYYIIFEESTD